MNGIARSVVVQCGAARAGGGEPTCCVRVRTNLSSPAARVFCWDMRGVQGGNDGVWPVQGAPYTAILPWVKP